MHCTKLQYSDVHGVSPESTEHAIELTKSEQKRQTLKFIGLGVELLTRAGSSDLTSLTAGCGLNRN